MTAAQCGVAIVGAGYMAREHARAFADVPGATLTGICSRTRERAEAVAREFAIPFVCDSVEELYDRTRAALVVVTVAELAMKAVTRECCAFPWTLLLEKPPGHDLTEALEIQRLTDAQARPAFVALNRRFYASTRAARARLASIDGPRFVHVLDQEDQAAAVDTGQPHTIVRNWMYANSIHVIDLLRLFGRGGVTAVDSVIPWNPDRPGITVSRIQFDSGDIGLYEGVWNGPGPWAAIVTTAAERWELRPLETATYQRRGERTQHAADPDPWDSAFKPGLRREAEAAVTAARGLPSESTTIADAVATMRLIAAIFGHQAHTGAAG